ncbi:hypothetical protein ACC797_11920 [Rhizobium ruizarguesonis]
MKPEAGPETERPEERRTCPRACEIHRCCESITRLNMAESQDVFDYTVAVQGLLSDSFSPARLAPYLALPEVGGDPVLAFKWYLWNARLSKAFLFPLQAAEVVVRNAIHRAFSNFLGGPGWVFSPPFTLNPKHAASHASSLTRLRLFKADPTSDDAVACLSFDFWSNLFRDDYEALWIVPGLLEAVFPNAPKGADRERIQKLVKRINKLRNRIAHHEPVHAEHHRSKLDSTGTILDFVCMDTRRWVDMHMTVRSVMRSQPTPSSNFAGRPITSTNLRPPLILNAEVDLANAIRRMKLVRPPGALVADAARNPPYAFVSLSDVANFIEQKSAAEHDIICLSEHIVAEVVAIAGDTRIATLRSDATTGDAMALFFPKGAASPRPQIIIVVDQAGDLIGLIPKPAFNG